jgi:septal ring factor EnvC (AmiA/AmiB activator)
MAKDKRERIKKINEQIKNLNETIRQSKEKIKSLKSSKKKLEQEIKIEDYAELKSVLQDYGITTVKDFEKFIDEYNNPQKTTANVDENEILENDN